MQRLLLGILMFLLSLTGFGQLYTISDQYVYNSLAINPAYSGSEGALSASVLYRNSMSGFEGAPKTMSVSIHTPLNNERVGLGFLIINDIIGVTRETSTIGNYAYRMDLGYGKLAFGLGFGATVAKTEWNKLDAQDVDDEQLSDDYSTGIMPDFSLGIYYNTEKYFIGLSAPLFLSHVYDSKTDKYKLKNDFNEYNYFFNSGYIFTIDQNIRFFPSLLIKYNQGDAAQLDINSQVIFKDRFWVGVSYRSKNILIGMLQCKINNQFKIAYSYDFNIGKYGQNINGAHEIMLNYVFDYKVDAESPRRF